MPIFIAGATGYIARALIPELLARGHQVKALVRPGSERKLPPGATAVVGNPLDATTFAGAFDPGDTFIQLVGVPHPSPAKAEQFRQVDLVAVRESVKVASRVRHFIYLSVAQPAPVMQAYLAVRAEGERLLRESGIPSTFVRPWYVLGPGHRWPYAILPLYWIWVAFPKHRETARRLYPVTLAQVVRAIVGAVEQPPDGVRIIEGPEMRRAAATRARPAARTAPAHPPR